MAQFTTRVELHEHKNGVKPSGEDYKKLHAAMAAKGFSRTIKADSGTVYHLPFAEYDRAAAETRATILKDAREATATVWSEYSILVTESAGRTWHNLKAV